MNDDFPSIPVPPLSDSVRERARHRALIAFRAQAVSPPELRASLFWRLLVGGSAAFALAVFCALFFLPQPVLTPNARETQLLAQMHDLFGSSLSALLESRGRVEIQSSSDHGQPADQPLLIEMVQGRRKTRVLAFSGRDIELPIGDRTVQVDPLVTGEGDVLLVGEDFIIRNQGAEEGVRFRTRKLDVAL